MWSQEPAMTVIDQEKILFKWADVDMQILHSVLQWGWAALPRIHSLLFAPFGPRWSVDQCTSSECTLGTGKHWLAVCKSCGEVVTVHIIPKRSLESYLKAGCGIDIKTDHLTI